MLTEEVCERKWLSFMSKKNTIKFIDPQGRLIPLKNNLHPKIESKIEIEEEYATNRRKKIFKKFNQKLKRQPLSQEYENFKIHNQKYEKKEFHLPIFASEKSNYLIDKFKVDLTKESQKEILDHFDIPPRKPTSDNSSLITNSKFVSYENFITENESKLKANLVNTNYHYFNTKRKRCKPF